MTNRIDEMFAALREKGECALIPYLTGGFPHLDRTVELMHALEAGGVDLIELGVPFSDPIADGPTIQRASSEALDAGTTVPGVLKALKEFRSKSDIPVILFGAYNPFFHYGLDRFAADAAAAGADGVLIPDVPADEADEVRPVLQAAGLHLISLVAPTTQKQRKQEICNCSTGFIYYISVKGVTGARASVSADLEDPVRELRACSQLPVAVGFGISTPEQAAAVACMAEGVVVGSALIDLISRERDSSKLPAKVTEFMRSLKQAMVANRSQVAAKG